jgi:hypothetical protein
MTGYDGGGLVFLLCVRVRNGSRAVYLDPNMFWGLLGIVRTCACFGILRFSERLDPAIPRRYNREGFNGNRI